ncbi:hypothetical protein LWI29_021575 [Acer saccharum]|uniref:Uncharacterized protein n=1 Tax=Acer saccharum TaxID=4024 RepID=A0AA39T3T0_ACESA|nr:hypothetical protein LWI29_021575 [Acer saccharum]
MMEPTQIVWDLRQAEEEMVDVVVVYASKLFDLFNQGLQTNDNIGFCKVKFGTASLSYFEELPVEIIDARLMQSRELKPVDETHDFYKKQQLRELAMLNGTLHKEGSPMSGSVSPFHNSLGTKRAKTRG